MVRYKNLSLSEARTAIEAAGEPRYRAAQLAKWVYQKRLDSFEQMHNFSKTSRESLGRILSLEKLAVDTCLVSKNNDAVKFGFVLSESADIVESVVLLDGTRRTACLSSQLGCGLNCAFCATGAMGFIRNLTLGEITGQLIGINDYLAAHDGSTVGNIVFMGMGEALSNFEAFKNSCEIIMDSNCFGLSAGRITVSTAGVIPSIERLKREGPPVQLAISLNGHSNEQRSKYMPVNKTYPIEKLIAAARSYALKTDNEVTFEYVVIPGENDTPAAVNSLVKLLHGLPCKVNCIPVNQNPGNVGHTQPYEAVQAFSDTLFSHGITSTVRRSRGADIDGACGQLAGKRRVSA